MNVLAAHYRSQGKLSQAESLHAKAWEAGRRVLGDEHNTPLSSLSGSAGIYNAEGKYGRAEELLLKVVSASRRALGDRYPKTLGALHSLGVVQLQRREYAAAEAVFREALLSWEKTKPDGWQRYSCQSKLGESLLDQRRYSEAEPLLLSGYDALIHREAAMPREGRESLENAGRQIVRLYQDWDKAGQAAEWKHKLQR